MKKIIPILIFTLAVMIGNISGQTVYGVAGSNSFSGPLTDAVMDSIVSIPAPGDTFGIVIRQDHVDDIMTAADVQTTITLNNKFIAEGKHLELVYTVEARGVRTAADNLYGFYALLTAGIDVAAVKFGNEEYASEKTGHTTFSHYQNDCNAVLAELDRIGYKGDRIFSVAPNDGRKDHLLWNDALAAFIAPRSDYHLDPHYYDKTPITLTLDHEKLPESTYTGNYLAEKDNFFNTLCHEQTTSSYFADFMAFLAVKFPGKHSYFTEVGPFLSTGNLNNTMGGEISTAYVFHESLKYPNQIRGVYKFNGPSPTPTGFISPRNKMDAGTDPYICRLAYFTFKQFFKYKDNPDYVFYFNASRIDSTLKGGYKDMDYISGDNYYSGIGYREWITKGSVLPAIEEIRKTKLIANTILPAISYGYYIPGVVMMDTITSCHDSTFTTLETVPELQDRDSIRYDARTVTVPCSVPPACSGWFYKLFHAKTCKCAATTTTVYDPVKVHYQLSVAVLKPVTHTTQVCHTEIIKRE